MTLSAKALDALYTRYGFSVEPLSGSDLRVYVLRQGYLYGADIVPLRSGVAYEDVQRQYQSGGYATNVKNYSSVEAAADSLFTGFFSTNQTADHLRDYYSKYVGRHTKVLGFPYQYIPSPFSLDGLPATDRCLISTVCDALKTPGPHLVLIEAAAGFGKTCAAYEILRSLVNLPVPLNPIFAELSRNRQARVFRYVLLDEIDRSYPSLASNLVQSEIRSGRLPLIIDGFDELLSKRPSSPSAEQRSSAEQFESVESMLDTIAALLVDEAKVILTTRRTAIFAGNEFQKWVSSRPSPFKVIRIGLNAPSISDWIGPSRSEQLARRGVRMDALGNPVLLGFLRNTSDKEFQSFCADPDLLTREYFQRLLDREKQRQDLHLSTERQVEIFRNLANSMVDADISSDTREMLATMILSESGSILQESLSTYSAAERPTVDELADKLTGHALLDRVGRSDDVAGFINDFVFGTLIGDGVLERPDNEWCASEPMFTRAVTAFRVRSESQRTGLWNKLKFESDLLDDARLQLLFDVELCGSEKRAFSGETFVNVDVANITLGLCGAFRQCTFVQCVFNSVDFHWNAFADVGFVNCQFYACRSTGVPDRSIWSAGGKEHGCDVLGHMSQQSSKNSTEVDGQEKAELTHAILAQFWPANNAQANLCLPLDSLRKGVSFRQVANVDIVLALLEKKGLLKVKGELVILNDKKIGEIEILKKGNGKG